MPCARTLLAGEESSSQLEAGLGDCCHHPFEGPSVVEQYAPHSVLAPVHIHAQLDFTRMAEQRLSGTVAITVRRSTGGGSTTDKQQDDSHMLAPLARMLTLNAVAFSEVKAECKESPLASSTYNGKELALEWSAPFEHGEERTVVVRYVVERPVSGMFFVAPSARRWLPDSGAAGKLHVITDHETERYVCESGCFC